MTADRCPIVNPKRHHDPVCQMHLTDEEFDKEIAMQISVQTKLIQLAMEQHFMQTSALAAPHMELLFGHGPSCDAASGLSLQPAWTKRYTAAAAARMRLRQAAPPLFAAGAPVRIRLADGCPRPTRQDPAAQLLGVSAVPGARRRPRRVAGAWRRARISGRPRRRWRRSAR